MRVFSAGARDVYMLTLVCLFQLEGMAAYGCLLLAPVEGWWPLGPP